MAPVRIQCGMQKRPAMCLPVGLSGFIRNPIPAAIFGQVMIQNLDSVQHDRVTDDISSWRLLDRRPRTLAMSLPREATPLTIMSAAHWIFLSITSPIYFALGLVFITRSLFIMTSSQICATSKILVEIAWQRRQRIRRSRSPRACRSCGTDYHVVHSIKIVLGLTPERLPKWPKFVLSSMPYIRARLFRYKPIIRWRYVGEMETIGDVEYNHRPLVCFPPLSEHCYRLKPLTLITNGSILLKYNHILDNVKKNTFYLLLYTKNYIIIRHPKNFWYSNIAELIYFTLCCCKATIY